MHTALGLIPSPAKKKKERKVLSYYPSVQNQPTTKVFQGTVWSESPAPLILSSYFVPLFLVLICHSPLGLLLFLGYWIWLFLSFAWSKFFLDNWYDGCLFPFCGSLLKYCFMWKQHPVNYNLLPQVLWTYHVVFLHTTLNDTNLFFIPFLPLKCVLHDVRALFFSLFLHPST